MGIVDTDFIFAFGTVTRASRAHPIEHTDHPHELNWALRYYSSNEAAISSPI